MAHVIADCILRVFEELCNHFEKIGRDKEIKEFFHNVPEEIDDIMVNGLTLFGEEIFSMSTIQQEVFTLEMRLQILLIHFMKDMVTQGI